MAVARLANWPRRHGHLSQCPTHRRHEVDTLNAAAPAGPGAATTGGADVRAKWPCGIRPSGRAAIGHLRRDTLRRGHAGDTTRGSAQRRSDAPNGLRLPAGGARATLERADDVSRDPPAVEPAGLWRHHLVVDEAAVHRPRVERNVPGDRLQSAGWGWGTPRRRWRVHGPQPAPRSIRHVPSTRRTIRRRRVPARLGGCHPAGCSSRAGGWSRGPATQMSCRRSFRPPTTIRIRRLVGSRAGGRG